MDEKQQTGAAAPEVTAGEAQIFPLDDATIDGLGELRQQMSPFIVASNALVSVFLRRHKLPGNWRVADNGRELVRMDAPPTAAAK